MSNDQQDQLLLHIRGAVAEYERVLIADRTRRGRQAKFRSGQLLTWSRAPYGYLLDPDRPRAPSRVQLDPVQAAVVTQIFAWDTAPRTPVSLYWVAKRLSDEQMPTPSGKVRWNVASVRGVLRSPAYAGAAYWGRTRSAPARSRKSALQPVGPGESHQPAPPEEWLAIPVPAIVGRTHSMPHRRVSIGIASSPDGTIPPLRKGPHSRFSMCLRCSSNHRRRRA